MPQNAHFMGVISDTHGLLRPEAIEALQGAEAIVHAGDVGDPLILDELTKIAPVHAVRGNVDMGPWATHLPETQVVQIGDVNLYVLHDRDALNLNPETAGFRAVIFGHSHRPMIEEQNGVLFLNPGSAGPRRPDRPGSVAHLQIQNSSLKANLVELL